MIALPLKSEASDGLETSLVTVDRAAPNAFSFKSSSLTSSRPPCVVIAPITGIDDASGTSSGSRDGGLIDTVAR